MKILVIEPDQVLASSTAKFLEAHGHQINVVDNAQDAIHTFDETQIELIILEPKISSHNGVELIHELRSYDDLRTIPIVIYTSLSPAQFNLSTQQKSQLGVRAVYYKSLTTLKNLSKNIEGKQNA